MTGDYFQAKYFAQQLYPQSLEMTYEKPAKTILAKHEMASAMIAPFDGERSAVIFTEGRPLGIVGEFKPEVSRKFKLPKKCAGFEMFLSGIGKSKNSIISEYRPMSKYPSIDQDISLKTDSKTKYDDITKTLEESLMNNSPDDIEVETKCIDIFSKDNKTKHTTFRLTATSSKRTLTAQIINKLLEKVELDLKKKINAVRI